MITITSVIMITILFCVFMIIIVYVSVTNNKRYREAVDAIKKLPESELYVAHRKTLSDMRATIEKIGDTKNIRSSTIISIFREAYNGKVKEKRKCLK